jgi:CO/xanthine dehydrogenase Mo-binding subunit
MSVQTDEARPLEIDHQYEILEKRGFSRATFLKGGGALVIGLVFPAVAASEASANASPVVEIPTVSPAAPINPGALSSWLAIGADGTVTGFTGKVDLGQGNQTALSQVIAEELYVPIDSVTLIMGNTDLCVNQGYTAGSSTIQAGAPQLRQAAASGYQTLLQMASTALGAPVSSLYVSNGVVRAPGAKSISYGDLVKGQVLTASIPFKGTPSSFQLQVTNTKPVDQYTVVGKSIPRVDIPPKVTAKYEYVHDIRVPGMLHGRVIRPPALGAQLVSVGTPPAGVRVVRVGNFLGVAAEREWDAIKAAQNLKTQWTSWAGLPNMADLNEFIYSTPSKQTVVQQAGNVAKGIASAAQTIQAAYDTPMETHGSIGPSCGLVDVQPSQVLVWAGTQGPNGLITAVAQVLGVSPSIVHVYSYPASGCYGRNGADPAVIDAAIMSQQLGAPVRVQWMRADEHGWDPKGPATIHQMEGGIDGSGNVVGYQHEGWLAGAEYDTSIIGAALAGKTAYTGPPSPGWSGNLSYTFPNFALISNQQPDLASTQNNGVGVISAWLRSPAQFQITFAQESFIDELAALAGIDPVEFRLRQLTDQRFIEVLTRTADNANWDTRPSPSNAASGKTRVVTGRGVAISLRGGTYDGNAAEVQVDRHTGKVRVTKIWGVQDNGLSVNPRAIVLGAEAAIVQTVSRTLYEQVTFNNSAITSLNWQSYPILRFEEAPEVNFQVLSNPSVAGSGSGEPPMTPTAAAIGNAVFDATGVRLRSLPFRVGYVKAALEEAGKSV